MEEFVVDSHARVVGQRSRRLSAPLSIIRSPVETPESNRSEAANNSAMANLDNPRVQHSSVIEPGAYNNTPGAVQARPTSYSTGTNDITCPSANQVNVARRRSTLWTLNLRQPIWTDAQVDPIDGKYFHFFLLHMNHHVIYGDLFPNLMTEVFARTLQSKPLRHAVLAVSAALVDEYLQRPAVRALVHKQQAITSLQQSLGTGDITEEVAISIFILLSMDAFNSSIYLKVI